MGTIGAGDQQVMLAVKDHFRDFKFYKLMANNARNMYAHVHIYIHIHIVISTRVKTVEHG